MLTKRKYIAPTKGSWDNLQVIDDGYSELIGPNMIDALILSGVYLSDGLLFGLIPALQFYNPIFSKINYSEKSVSNFTIFPHILFPGEITRYVKDMGDGVYILTVGKGDGVVPILSPFVNKWGGKFLFKFLVDYPLRRDFGRSQ